MLSFSLKNKSICILVLLVLATLNSKLFSQPKKDLIDFFLPMEPQSPLVSKGIWGDAVALPRDISNGLEDPKLKNWCYWDGSIVKDNKGVYHMYASRWTQELSHSKGWHIDTKAVHAVSKNVMGPYIDKGLVYPHWREGLGHNIVALKTHEGKYAVVTSEVSRGEIFIADNPNGPFKLLGEIKVDANGFDPGLARYDTNNKGAVKAGVVGHMSNVQIILLPEGQYMLIPRFAAPMISKDGILGPYKIMADKIYKGMQGIPQEKMEDPTIWYSGGLYHLIVNYHGVDTSYHFTSPNGINNWKSRGIAFKKDAEIFKYTNGVVNNWAMVQRMTVYVENGHPTHFLFSVIDVHKGKDKANDNHGSKIVIVPFNGKAFDKYMKKLVKAEKKLAKK
ncbi:MAG: glycoside hydrolase family protein [Cellulophaga fucicola]